MSFNLFRVNKKRTVRCSLCDRVYPTLEGELALDPRNYICDDCKMHAKNPRLIQPHQVKTVEGWHPDRDESNKCNHCGTLLWVFKFKLLVDREVEDANSELFIKPHDEVITAQDCPNPECSHGWGKKPNDAFTPMPLRPPWAVMPRVLVHAIPELNGAKRKEPDGTERALSSEERQAVYEHHLQIYHVRWWAEWQQLHRREAGKGTLARWLSMFKTPKAPDSEPQP